MRCQFVTFLVAEPNHPQLAVPQQKKFVYLKSVLPATRCQFVELTFLAAEPDRAAAARAAAEKVCVRQIGFARHA